MPLDLNLTTSPIRGTRGAGRCVPVRCFPRNSAAAFKDELGMDASLVSVDNTQAYLATNDKHLVVAFRGSEGRPASTG